MGPRAEHVLLGARGVPQGLSAGHSTTCTCHPPACPTHSLQLPHLTTTRLGFPPIPTAGFLLYTAWAVGTAAWLILRTSPETKATNPLVSLAICSAVGSLSVVACKALGLALKLSLAGDNQFVHPATWVFAGVVVAAVLTQMTYLNIALDLFSTALVTPLYYAGFTTLTLLASAAMFRTVQGWAATATQASGFVTILCGTTLLHVTRDLGDLPFAAVLGGGAAAAKRPGPPGDDGVELLSAKDARV